jgi:WD40 repeat protein
MTRYFLAVGLLAAVGAAQAEEPMLKLPVSQTGVSRVLYTPDGTRLAGMSYTGDVVIWDTRTGKELNTLKLGGNGVYTATFVNDGKTLAAVTMGLNGRGSHIRLHDVRTGMETARWAVKETPTGLAESPDGTLLAAACGTKVRVFEIATGDERPAVSTPANENLGGGLGWTPDSKRVIFPVYSRQGKSELLVCEADGGAVVHRLPAGGGGFGGRSLAVTPDGAELIAPGPLDPNTGTAKLTVWDLKTGKQLRTLGTRGFSAEFVLTPDGKRFIAGEQATGEVVMAEVATGKVVKTWKGWYMNGMDIAPDGNSFAACGTDMSDQLNPTQAVVRVRIDHLKK